MACWGVSCDGDGAVYVVASSASVVDAAAAAAPPPPPPPLFFRLFFPMLADRLIIVVNGVVDVDGSGRGEGRGTRGDGRWVMLGSCCGGRR